MFKQSDLPRRGLSKVALHFVYRPQRPLLEGGESRLTFCIQDTSKQMREPRDVNPILRLVRLCEMSKPPGDRLKPVAPRSGSL